MTDHEGFANDAETNIVYVRGVKTADLPGEIQDKVEGTDQMYAIHSSTGEVLALVSDRDQAFAVALENEYSPVSVH